MTIRYTLPALADLDRLLAYVAQRSPQGARHVLDDIRKTERLIAQFPQAGRATRRRMIRRIKVLRRPYLMFYQPTGIGHAIRHGARDPATMPDGT